MSSKRIRKKKKKAAEWKNCPLCGKALPFDPDLRVTGATGRSICKHCLHIANIIAGLDTELYSEKNPIAFSLTLSPSDALSKLNEVIIGQDNAKRAVVMALWKQLRRRSGDSIPNASLLLYGPTGCGKTALIREAARIMGVPFISADATSVSETGYRGRDTADLVKDLVKQCGSVEKAAYGVIFVDEFDKLAADRTNDYRASYCRGTQFSFLKLIEGADVDTDDGVINTSNILFLFGGAFSQLTDRQQQTPSLHKKVGFLWESQPKIADNPAQLTPEDFISFGMEPELMGRVGRCLALSPLTEESMKKILLESKLSVYRKYQVYFHQNGKRLTMSEAEIKELVQRALARNMGARGLNALVEEWVEPQLAALAEEQYGVMGA